MTDATVTQANVDTVVDAISAAMLAAAAASLGERGIPPTMENCLDRATESLASVAMTVAAMKALQP